MATSLPSGTAWINQLSKSECVDLCLKFSLESEGTLDEIRKRLREYVRTLDGDEACGGLNAVANPPQGLPDGSKFPGSGLNITLLESIIVAARRWEIRFGGQAGESVMSFLEKFTRFTQHYELEDVVALKLIPEILHGRARNWYWANSFSRIGDFYSEVKAAFGVPNYQMRLRRDIYNRTQGTHESLAEYVVVIQSMNRRLDEPFPEETLLEVICSNLNPNYVLQLINKPKSFDELVRWGRNYDERRGAAELYREPPPAEEMVDPEFGDRNRPAPRETRPFVNARSGWGVEQQGRSWSRNRGGWRMNNRPSEARLSRANRSNSGNEYPAELPSHEGAAGM
jgi:hypothetical protein